MLFRSPVCGLKIRGAIGMLKRENKTQRVTLTVEGVNGEEPNSGRIDSRTALGRVWHGGRDFGDGNADDVRITATLTGKTVARTPPSPAVAAPTVTSEPHQAPVATETAAVREFRDSVTTTEPSATSSRGSDRRRDERLEALRQGELRREVIGSRLQTSFGRS